MKKIMLSALVLAATALGASAQTQKGYYLIGGNIGNISADLQKSGSKFGIGITPKVAWFVQDNLAIGGQVGLGYTTQKNAGNTFTYSIGPLARYYFGDAEMEKVKINAPKPVRFFAEANAGLAGSNYNPKEGASSSTNGFNVGIGPGVAFFLNENIALEALAKYDLTLGFGSTPALNKINVGVGFQIYLPGSKLKALRNDMK
ncbi:outer membrane beta-barrel protein [Niabella beijingensis]|uniref:outer membrane beta-barrel protein n=1 Tax=Niabella beijingensis TaxID=2872700 RepID=UPI001CBF6AD9|nr:outer membrane beta-barrel protein [Niabella beijingensis]MBZ4187874.1 porin family protein [Niabella beijingensis]